ncbi:sodium:solute symporter family transporter [Haloplanus ruber]|uniref:Na+/proline symporter n=1 Tax=Haloplanus ruber TaxID=869892 RepID=A0ABD6CWW1_9EURY|nr:hypothetical protein [Haloplanus ruber]
MALPLINIGIVLLLGTVFIGVGWYFSRRSGGTDDFILGGGQLGIALGMTSLLAFWITGNTMLAAPESAYTYGILGALGYGMLGGAGVLLFALLSKRLHKVIPHGKSVGDFYGTRYDEKNYYVFVSLLVIYVLGLIVTQGIGGGVLLEQIFDIPYYLAVFLTFGIVIVYAYLGGFRSVTGVAYFQVLLILVVALVVPPLVYFNVGFGPVYERILADSPAKLSLTAPSGLLFATAGALLGIGEVFMDNTFWQRAYAIRSDVVAKTFGLSGIGWILVPLAIASLSFVALAFDQTPEQVNQVAPMIAQIYGGAFSGWLFLIAVWSALCSTTAASINALATLLMNDAVPRVKDDVSEDELLRYGKYFTLLVGVLGLLFSLPRILTMLQMLFFLGVINVAFVFPIVAGLWWEKANPQVVFVATTTATIVGYAAYFTIGANQGIILSGWISCVITYGGSYLWPKDFDWGKLQRVGQDVTAGGDGT